MELFKSKKFIMSAVGVVAMVVSHFFPVIGEDQILGIAGIIVAYVVGQGIADGGKSAAIINKG